MILSVAPTGSDVEVAMDGAAVREVFETTCPDEALPEWVRETGFEQREKTLDEIGACNPPTVRTLVYAAITASIIVCVLAHHHRLEEDHPPKTRPYRDKPPIPPRALGRRVAVSACRVAMAFDTAGPEADAEWQALAELFTHQGTDPGWRRYPSVLDPLRG